MVRYYGSYSNVCRGRRKKANEDRLVPSILQSDEPSKGYRKNWARLIQKIYEIDKHLDLWDVKPRPPPRIAKAQPLSAEPYIDLNDD